jgi:hypothetical protein
VPDVGNMVQNAAPERVISKIEAISEIEAMIGKLAHGTAAAAK